MQCTTSIFLPNLSSSTQCTYVPNSVFHKLYTVGSFGGGFTVIFPNIYMFMYNEITVFNINIYLLSFTIKYYIINDQTQTVNFLAFFTSFISTLF